jgi:hypothetical protein
MNKIEYLSVDRFDDGIELEFLLLLLGSAENLSKRGLIFAKEIIYKDEKESMNHRDVINENE